MGSIYTMTNPSFNNYVKIGYAKNAKQYLNRLNRSIEVPFDYRIYAEYETDANLSDIKVHQLIDKINPDLSYIETDNGKRRVREF